MAKLPTKSEAEEFDKKVDAEIKFVSFLSDISTSKLIKDIIIKNK